MAKKLKAEDMNKCIGCFTCMLICAGVNRKDHSLRKSCISVKTHGGITGRLVAIVCRACRRPQCAAVCPTEALAVRKGGGVILDAINCIGCGRCADACILEAVKFDNDTNKPIICHHCGVCANFCPHGCLQLIEVPD